MEVFVYRAGKGCDATIYLVFAEDREDADRLCAQAEGLTVDDPDFEAFECTEYGMPEIGEAFVLFCG